MSASDPTQRREIGKTGVMVPGLCFGGSVLGSMPDTYGYPVSDAQARATVDAIFDGPCPFVDTSRNYGMGRSEQRIGDAIRARGGVPDHVVLSSKLDRDMETLRFDADRARRSVEESLEALGVGKIDILHLHDPEHAADLAEITSTGGAIDELFKMKEEGLCSAVGLAAGNVDVMIPLLKDWDFDALITHNRFSLANRNAEPMMDLAVSKNTSVLMAAPYAGGVLAKGTSGFQRYVYQDASDEMLEPIRAIEAVCGKYKIPMGAAALQFSLRDPRVTSTIIGVSKPERVAGTLDWASVAIPEEAWADLLALPYSTDDPEATRDYTPD